MKTMIAQGKGDFKATMGFFRGTVGILKDYADGKITAELKNKLLKEITDKYYPDIQIKMEGF